MSFSRVTSFPSRRSPMLYISTRGAADGKTFADITFEGLARDGGLYVPENYPKFTADELAQLRGRDFSSVALDTLQVIATTGMESI